MSGRRTPVLPSAKTALRMRRAWARVWVSGRHASLGKFRARRAQLVWVTGWTRPQGGVEHHAPADHCLVCEAAVWRQSSDLVQAMASVLLVLLPSPAIAL